MTLTRTQVLFHNSNIVELDAETPKLSTLVLHLGFVTEENRELAGTVHRTEAQ